MDHIQLTALMAIYSARAVPIKAGARYTKGLELLGPRDIKFIVFADSSGNIPDAAVWRFCDFVAAGDHVIAQQQAGR